MSRELEQMRDSTMQSLDRAKQTLHENGKTVDDHLRQIQAEYKRVADISHNAPAIVEDLDRKFKEKTKLEDSDIKFLFICAGLQIFRQTLLPTVFANEKRLTAMQGDKLIKNVLGPVTPKAWQEIFFSSVPYDALSRTAELKELGVETGLAGTTHRYRTLGQDPVLGWFFGTVNILTGALTKSDIITTYSVRDMYIEGGDLLGTPGMVNDSIPVVRNDPIMLPAALARQVIHFGSDYFTGQGLPLPFLGTVAPETAHRFMNSSLKDRAHLDMLNITTGAVLAALINQVIYYVHKMFYNEAVDGPMSLYEVRTRKILSHSNVMSTGCNVLNVAITKKVSQLDVGGILETIHRLINDYTFIQKVKRDFLKDEIYKMVVGDPYDFMEGK